MRERIDNFRKDGEAGSSVKSLPPIASGQRSEVTNAANSQPATDGDTARDAYNWFASNGYSPAAAAGIVGNLVNESGNGLDPRTIHDGGTGLGIAGWRDPEPGKGRKTGLLSFADANGLDPYDRQTQYRFLDHELKTSEAGVGKRLAAAQTPEDAGAIMVDFERPGGWKQGNPTGANGYQNRVAAARRFYDSYGSAPAQPKSLPPLDDTPVPASAGKRLPALAENDDRAHDALAIIAKAFGG